EHAGDHFKLARWGIELEAGFPVPQDLLFGQLNVTFGVEILQAKARILQLILDQIFDGFVREIFCNSHTLGQLFKYPPLWFAIEFRFYSPPSDPDGRFGTFLRNYR